jgi:hypothetical protein
MRAEIRLCKEETAGQAGLAVGLQIRRTRGLIGWLTVPEAGSRDPQPLAPLLRSRTAARRAAATAAPETTAPGMRRGRRSLRVAPGRPGFMWTAQPFGSWLADGAAPIGHLRPRL